MTPIEARLRALRIAAHVLTCAISQETFTAHPRDQHRLVAVEVSAVIDALWVEYLGLMQCNWRVLPPPMQHYLQ